MSSNRADRIGMEIHRALAEVLREDISDPRVSTMCSVVRTEAFKRPDVLQGVYQRIRHAAGAGGNIFRAYKGDAVYKASAGQQAQDTENAGSLNWFRMIPLHTACA